MAKAKVWIKAKEFSGNPTKEDFRLVEEELPELKDGDVLFEATCLSVDPYMRVYPVTVGDPMFGEQVAKVVESRNPDYKVGTVWACFFGWRTHTVFNPSKQFDNIPKVPGLPDTLDLRKVGMPAYLTKQPVVFEMPQLGDLPHSLALGTVGVPGVTAYLGLLEHCSPQPGEMVLVNGAAGAVGNVVGQIAKNKGCKVIGYAGSDDKVRWLKEELGFDFAFNYKKVDLSESIKEAAPDGIDIYYDNVGGDFSDTVLAYHMKMYSRVLIIGVISEYNATSTPSGRQLYLPLLIKNVNVRGLGIQYESRTKWVEAFTQLTNWLSEGLLKYREHITRGFDKMPEAFIGLFKGENTGKAIVKV